jgi:hypothetical protein
MVREDDMALGNEKVIRQAYKIADDKDLQGWVAAFTEAGQPKAHSNQPPACWPAIQTRH